MGASSDDDMWRILLALLANRVRFEDQHPRYAAFIAESPSTAFGYSSPSSVYGIAEINNLTAFEKTADIFATPRGKILYNLGYTQQEMLPGRIMEAIKPKQ
jgi:hypothetical protein